jgi:hypothetical protein
MIRNGYWCLLILCAVCLVACEQERDPCLQPKTVPMRVVARQPDSDTTTIDTLLPGAVWIGIDSMFAIGFPENSSAFSLLLSPLADSSRYALQPDSAIASFDTLTFYYRRKLQFLSNACGFTYFFSLDSIHATAHNIDSFKINNADVNQDASSPEHVQIFF